MTHDVYELLERAEIYLGGFMGSRSAFRRVEDLREEIREALHEQKQLIRWEHEEKAK